MRAGKVVVVYGIDIRTCAWCGEPFIALRTGKRAVITCSAACHKDNWRYVRSESARRRHKKWVSIGSEAGRA